MITEVHRRHLSESHMGIKRTPEALAKFKKSMKKRWTDPEYRERVIQARVGYKHSEKTKQKLSKTHLSISEKQETDIIKLYKSLTADEIGIKLNLHRAIIFSCLHRHKIQMRPIGIRMGKIPWNKDLKLSEEQKAKLNMEGLKIGHPWNKGKIGIYSEEYLKQKSDALRGKYIGEKASNWKGGLSFEPYSPEFNNSLKYEIRKRDKFICQFPNCGIKENGKAHDCHHKNYDKKDSRPENLITLCSSCHMKTNYNREYWQNYFEMKEN